MMKRVYVWGTGQKCQNMMDAGAFVINEMEGFVETEKSTDQFRRIKVYSNENIMDLG